MLFADLEMFANAAVLNQLSNVMVTIPGALDPVPGMFRNPAAVANLGMGAADAKPTVTIASNAVMAEPEGKQILIAGVAYIILTDAPDGTGLTVLTLGIA